MTQRYSKRGTRSEDINRRLKSHGRPERFGTGDSTHAVIDALLDLSDSAESEIARLTAALAESEAKRGYVIEQSARDIKDWWDAETQDVIPPHDVIRALDPDATAALEAHVKRAVDAETRACAEVILKDCHDDMMRDEEAAAILARIDLRKEAEE